MDNRFGALSKGSAKPAPKPKKAKPQESEEGTAATTGGAGGKAAATGPSEDKGFRLVEAKKNNKPKPKGDGNAGQQQQQKPKEKPVKPKWVGVPVGASPIDPEEEKREKKAAAALRKHYASQCKVVVQEPREREARDGDGDELPGLPVNKSQKGAAPLNTGGVVFEAAKTNGQSSSALKALHRDPASNPDAWGTKAKPATPAGGKGGKSNQKGNGKQQQPAPAPPKKEEKGQVVDHTHLEDGSVIANVAFGFLGADGKPLFLSTPAQLQTAVTFVTDALKAGKPIKGGFYISSEAHQFSNEQTIDEPWMVDSYFKALLSILSGKAPTAKAYPYWHPKVGKADAVEGEVNISLFGDTGSALVLQHDSKARISVKQLRVHKAEFTSSLFKEGQKVAFLLSKVTAALKESLPEKEVEARLQILPRHLPEHLEALGPLVRH